MLTLCTCETRQKDLSVASKQRLGLDNGFMVPDLRVPFQHRGEESLYGVRRRFPFCRQVGHLLVVESGDGKKQVDERRKVMIRWLD